jgi:hypothetical protein
MTVAAEELSDRLIARLLAKPGKVLIWGVSSAAVRALSQLRELGLEEYVAGVVDHRSGQQGMTIAGWSVSGPGDIRDLPVDYLAIGLDAEKDEVLRAFSGQSDRRPEIISYGVRHFDFRDELFNELVDTTYALSRCGGYGGLLVHIFQALRHVTSRGLAGDVAEFGVYKAGTTIFMARALKRFKSDALVYGFDTFSGFPEKGHVFDTYSYAGDEFRELDVVRANCGLYDNIRLVVGDITQTCTRLAGSKLAFTFFDTDNYSATRAALPICAEATVPGGILAFDHYYSPDWPYPMGERLAAQEILDDREWLNLHGTGLFIKV